MFGQWFVIDWPMIVRWLDHGFVIDWPMIVRWFGVGMEWVIGWGHWYIIAGEAGTYWLAKLGIIIK